MKPCTIRLTKYGDIKHHIQWRTNDFVENKKFDIDVSPSPFEKHLNLYPDWTASHFYLALCELLRLWWWYYRDGRHEKYEGELMAFTYCNYSHGLWKIMHYCVQKIFVTIIVFCTLEVCKAESFLPLLCRVTLWHLYLVCFAIWELLCFRGKK